MRYVAIRGIFTEARSTSLAQLCSLTISSIKHMRGASTVNGSGEPTRHVDWKDLTRSPVCSNALEQRSGWDQLPGFAFSTRSAPKMLPTFGRSVVTPATSGTTLVEIYPARFLECAGVYRSGNSGQQQVKDALAFYNICLSPELENRSFTDDERDALVSAAGMKWWLSQRGSLAWSGASRTCTKYEGWIFGI